MRRLAVPAVLARTFAFCGAIALLSVVPGAAEADVFGPISLVSQGTLPGAHESQQVDYAHDPAVSGDGRYVAFDGSIGGVTGVWRRDLDTGAIEQVAGGDAELPSISESGRYISFTSTEDLVPADEPRGPNVWVRDMEPGPSESELILVSAVNGSTKGLTYEYPSNPVQEEQGYGAVAAGRSAISANGQEVAFVTTAASNLVTVHTPALQVAVRYLQLEETKLVSARMSSTDEPVSSQEGEGSYGAVFTGLGGKAPAFDAPPPYGEYGATPPLGASISADGSTVAWMGDDIGEQAPLLADESKRASYTEPLWRRIAPGSETPTRRISGGSDPANSACVASGETVLPSSASPTDPCQGPFATPEGEIPSGIWAGGGPGDLLPRLSADGYTVAFAAQAPLVSLGEDFGTGLFGRPSDLYVADMHEGLTRDQALTPLTELASGDKEDRATDAPIMDFGISPDGSQVAFTTERTQFPLGSPAYVSAPETEAGITELFDADLADGTLTRVTQGFEGGPSEHPYIPVPTGRDPYKEGDGALSPSFSDDGDTLAFSSTASNLAYGDGNTPPRESGGAFDGSDAFVISRVVFGSTPTPQDVSSPPELPLTPAWGLDVTAFSRPNGSVLLYVLTPGAGTARAGAQSAVVVAPPHPAHPARAGHRAHPAHAAHTAHTGHRASAARKRARRIIATRTVATRAANAQGAGLTMLTLTLAPRYAALAREHGGLSAMVTVTFTAHGHPTLRQSVAVTFLRKVKPSRSKRRSSSARRRVSKAGRRK